jgi:hypothetical protein
MIRFTVDAAHGVRIAEFHGVVDDDELMGAYARLVEQPDYDPTLNDMVDMRSVQRLDVTGVTLRRLVEMFAPLEPRDPPTRLAIVAPKDHVYGLGRMYEMLSTDTPEDIRVFREYAPAAAWLGLPEA